MTGRRGGTAGQAVLAGAAVQSSPRSRSAQRPTAPAWRATLRLVGLGLLLGAAWGAVARLFMRFLATEPEFSWGGTLAIMAVAAWLGALLGVVRAARLRGGSRWWRATSLLGAILFASPGMLLLPTAVACMLAVRFRRLTVRLPVVGVGLVGTLVPVLLSSGEEVPPDALIPPHMVAPVPGAMLLVVCAVLLGVGCAEATRPWNPHGARLPHGPGAAAAVV